MRPWMGAVAVATAMLVVPGSALAGEHDPALIQFKLPSKTEVHVLESMGLSLDHAIDQASDGSALASAWVTDAEKALVEARGYPAVKTIHDRHNIDRLRAEREQAIDDEQAAKSALKVNAAGKAGRSAAAGTVRATRADYFENNVGRFLSIEANTTQAQITCSNPTAGTGCSYTGPQLVTEWYDAAGNRLGGGNLGVYIDPDVNPDYYQYHYTVFRVGNKGDGGTMPASIKVAAPNGDVDTLATREWVAKEPPGLPAGFLADFNNRYFDSQESYKKMRDLATEFPNISQVYDLPEKTVGYQRKAQTMLGYSATSYVTFDASNRPVGSTANLSAANADRAVVLTSKAWGHEGGNSVTAQFVDPAAPNAALAVSLNGNAIRASLATDGAGAITSTATQVIDAINAHVDVSKLVTATKNRTSAAGGVVMAGLVSALSDLLRAPSTFPRGPQTINMLRIGKQRDATKVGVFLYCQEHGNEIATSAVCLETAERLVRNYGRDPETTALVDGLDIFIIPMVNGDGGTHSLYDSNRRTNLSNHCATGTYPGNEIDPAARNSWGVDLNRNFSQGTIFDGFQGATFSDCTNGNFAGPFEFSEPESRNERWVQSTFSNIKFVNNIHSSGGYFMWPPGAYKPTRETLPYPPFGTLNYFDQTGKEVLDRIKSHRETAILPQRTGPVIDVLYSAAGNSADEAYYSHGIVGYDFEIGATHYSGTTTCNPGQQPPWGDSTNDCLDNEGRHEAMEFSSGNYGLLKEALTYANDSAAPAVDAEWKLLADASSASFEVRFKSNEASSIYYTTDGSTPTTASAEWKPERARMLPPTLSLPVNTTLKWVAHDFKGNMSAVKSKTFDWKVEAPGGAGGTVPATLALTLGAPASFGAFTPGVLRTYTASQATTVTSSAGDALLSVADPSSTATGRLVNGAFSLAQAVQARVGSAALANVGSSAAPLSLKTYSGPVSNDAVAVEFSQLINANEALRTGSYSKALTFTLSTTQP